MVKKKGRDEKLTPWQQASQTEKNVEQPRVEQHRRHLLKDYQRRNFRKMWPLLAGLVLVIGFMLFVISPVSHVHKVKITGNEIVSIDQIKHYSPVRVGTSLFSVWGKTDRLAKNLKDRSQRMASVKIRLTSFNDIQIKVAEYPTIGYLNVDHGYQPILKSGVIVKNKILNPRDGFPILKKFSNSRILRRTIAQYRKISPPVRTAIDTISYSPSKTNPDRVFIQMNDGNRVYASISSFGDKMDYYPSINAKLKTKSVINLEIGAYSYSVSEHQTKKKASSAKSYSSDSH